jgi:quinoprotein glucose dehydrogenase
MWGPVMKPRAMRVFCTIATLGLQCSNALCEPPAPAAAQQMSTAKNLSQVASPAARKIADRTFRTWSVYNGGPESIHYSQLDQINVGNVGRLKPAWSYETGDAFGENFAFASEFESNPIVIGGVLFTTTPKGRVVSLDAARGTLIWAFDPHAGHALRIKQRSRGVTYWSEGSDERIFVVAGQLLYALDARVGAPIRTFGSGGQVDLRQGLGRDPEQLSASYLSPGIVYKDLIVLGSTGFAPGDIRAFDVRTGRIRWSFHTIPHPGEPGYETWPKDAWLHSNGANCWAGMSLDVKRGLLFVPTASAGQSLKDFYGADRAGDNLFADTLLALDADTGKRVWHFQFVHHDLWDRDLPAAPSLVTVRHGGRKIDAVAQITKSGLVYVFERSTGKPLFPIVERHYVGSSIPGEAATSHQPFPLLPAPFARQELTRDMLTQRTPEAHAAVVAQFDELASAGQFTPPSLGGTILFPGWDGGAEWGGAAFDPQTGLLYVNSNEMPCVLKMQQLPPRAANSAITARSLFVENCSGCHGADRKGNPPEFPPLVNLKERLVKQDVFTIITGGSGRMPGFARLGPEAIGMIADYVLYDIDGNVTGAWDYAGPSTDTADYLLAGYSRFLDPDGYPPMQPPWGTLNAINLNTGEYAWRIPFGEYPELAALGERNTGSDNYGGAVVTANGLLFIGATVYDRKLHAFDKRTGALLWETTLPAAGNATPALYEVGGREFLVIAAGGGKEVSSNPRARPGGMLVAFSLPDP